MNKAVFYLLTLCMVTLSATSHAAQKLDVKATLAACIACHDISSAKKALVGPPLFGVYGRKPLSVGLPYKKFDQASLDQWLRDPSKVKRETQMVFKVADKVERSKVIEALKTLK